MITREHNPHKSLSKLFILPIEFKFKGREPAQLQRHIRAWGEGVVPRLQTTTLMAPTTMKSSTVYLRS